MVHSRLHPGLAPHTSPDPLLRHKTTLESIKRLVLIYFIQAPFRSVGTLFSFCRGTAVVAPAAPPPAREAAGRLASPGMVYEP